MHRVLAPVFRSHYNLFFRSGYTYIPVASLVKIEGDISNEQTQSGLLECFKTLPPFEYDEEYLILELEVNPEKQKSGKLNQRFEIQDIVSIIPLSEQAKLSISNKIDPRVTLSPPLAAQTLAAIERHQFSEELRKGIEALWFIADINENLNNYLPKINLDSVIKGIEYRRKGMKAIQLEGEDYWSNLIVYERYEYFPNSSLGYFFDAGEILTYVAMSLEQKTAAPSPFIQRAAVYQTLIQLNQSDPNIKTEAIIDAIEKDSPAFLEKMTIDGVKAYTVAPIFLMLKDGIRNSKEFEDSDFFKFKDKLASKFGEEFKLVVILLGAFFGFEKFYDTYYDKLKLRIFKPVSGKEKLVVAPKEAEAKIAEPFDVEKKMAEAGSFPGTESKEQKRATQQKFVAGEQVDLFSGTEKSKPAQNGMEKSRPAEKSGGKKDERLQLLLKIISKHGQVTYSDMKDYYNKSTSGKKFTIQQPIINLLKKLPEIEEVNIENKKGVKIKETHNL